MRPQIIPCYDKYFRREAATLEDVPKKPDERRMRAWESLLRAHHGLAHALGRELEAEHGLTLAQYEVLLRLRNAPAGRMRMQDLAGAAFFSPSGMTRLIDRMAEAGWVERVKCDSDLRGTYASLTTAGRAALRTAATTHLRGIEQHFGRHLSDDEADAVGDSLSRIADAAAPLS